MSFVLHLLNLVTALASDRARLALKNDGNSPVPWHVDSSDGDVIGTPVLGGLHHTYRRAA